MSLSVLSCSEDVSGGAVKLSWLRRAAWACLSVMAAECQLSDASLSGPLQWHLGSLSGDTYPRALRRDTLPLHRPARKRDWLPLAICRQEPFRAVIVAVLEKPSVTDISILKCYHILDRLSKFPLGNWFQPGRLMVPFPTLCHIRETRRCKTVHLL